MAPKEYLDAWTSIRILVEQGASWSGREQNHLFLNLGQCRFADVSSVANVNCIGDGRSVATTDWDGDGRLDFFLKNRTGPRVQFFRNDDEAAGNALEVSLRGVRCNKDAIGALALVEAGGRTLRRRLHAGDSFLAQSSKTLHFGLGAATRVDRLTVEWPDGSRDVHQDLAAGQRVWITQGEPAPTRTRAFERGPLADVPARECRGISTQVARVPLVEKLALPPLELPAFDDPARKLGSLAGSPVLLNLWGVECEACLRELAELKKERARVDAAGLRVVTLTTDAPEGRERAAERIAGFGLREDAGYATPDLMAALRVLFTDLLGDFESVPLPTSLLLDAQGQLLCLYLGPLTVDELLADVALVARLRPEEPGDTLVTDGIRLVTRPRPWRSLADGFAKIGREDLARFYRRQARRDR